MKLDGWVHCFQRGSKSQRHILFLVLSTAVGLHLLALFLIQDMSLPALGGNHEWAFDERYVSEGSEEEDSRRQKEELERVFRSFVSQVDRAETAPSTLSELGGDFTPPSLEQLTVSIDNSTIDNWEQSIDFSDLMNDATYSIDAFEAQLDVEGLTPTDDTIADHLTQLTDSVFGVAEFQASDLLDGLLVGQDLAVVAHGSEEETFSRSNEGMQSVEKVEERLQKSLREDAAQFDSHLVKATHTRSSDLQSDLPTAGNATAPHVASSSDFHLEIDYAPNPEGKGYLFRLVLTPRSNVVFKTIAHNVFFLIDRSHSIDERRYRASKESVLHALSLLREGDTFNILVFDKKVSSFAPASVPVNQETVQQAGQWLQRQPHGGMFAATDLYASLGNIVPSEVGEQELNTAILLSDGDTYLAKDKQRRNVANWIQRNQGKVSLFSLAAGSRDNLAMLDLLSSFNKGRLAYARTYSDQVKTLEHLLASIQNPVGKNLKVSVVESKKPANAQLFVTGNQLPDLYKETPYILYGSCEQLEDFYVFLQGRYYDRFLDIKQKVNFAQAREISPQQLQRSWIMYQAYELYSTYLREGNHRYLNQVRQLLKPHGLPIAFE